MKYPATCQKSQDCQLQAMITLTSQIERAAEEGKQVVMARKGSKVGQGMLDFVEDNAEK